MTSLYVVRVDILEAATGYRYPVVRHEFMGRSPQEAHGYHEAHRDSDEFLRQCEDRGAFRGSVRCRARMTEGWRRTR